jgi:hypothetical protein
MSYFGKNKESRQKNKQKKEQFGSVETFPIEPHAQADPSTPRNHSAFFHRAEPHKPTPSTVSFFLALHRDQGPAGHHPPDRPLPVVSLASYQK